MLQLTGAVYLLVAPTLMGIALIAFLTIDQFSTAYGMIGWGALGAAIIGIPASWFVAKLIKSQIK